MPNENGNIDLYNLLHNNELDLWKSAAIVAMKLADEIKLEDTSTDHHEMRLSWAGQVLQNPDQWVNDNKWNIIKTPVVNIGLNGKVILVKEGEVSTPVTLDQTSTDTDIENVINQLVPA